MMLLKSNEDKVWLIKHWCRRVLSVLGVTDTCDLMSHCSFSKIHTTHPHVPFNMSPKKTSFWGRCFRTWTDSKWTSVSLVLLVQQQPTRVLCLLCKWMLNIQSTSDAAAVCDPVCLQLNLHSRSRQRKTPEQWAHQFRVCSGRRDETTGEGRRTEIILCAALCHENLKFFLFRSTVPSLFCHPLTPNGSVLTPVCSEERSGLFAGDEYEPFSHECDLSEEETCWMVLRLSQCPLVRLRGSTSRWVLHRWEEMMRCQHCSLWNDISDDKTPKTRWYLKIMTDYLKNNNLLHHYILRNVINLRRFLIILR